ncbi:MAG: TIR domain-containing protein, partial [Armatimonadetes bacterium]|nr:TIR domain-containing protein [Armatimonadota bacterium]
MQKPAKSPRVFISYSHKDSRELERLKVHLRPYEWSGAVDAWDDQRLVPGQQWLDEIKAAIAVADVAVLLVSPDFLASRFIRDNELPPLLAGKRVIWVAVSHCAYDRTAIAGYQCAHDPAKPLRAMTGVLRDKVLAGVCRVMADHVAPGVRAAPPVPVSDRITALALELVSIPAGRFQMGDDLRWEETGAYRIGKYPVTVAQYRRFCEKSGREMPSAPGWGWIEIHPIVNVTWHDARDFCEC